MRRGVMHVGGDPHHIDDAGTLDEGEQIGDLGSRAVRRAVAVRDRSCADKPIGRSAAITFQVALGPQQARA